MNTQRATNKNVPTANFFETDFTLNSLLKSTGTGANLSIPNLSTLLFKFSKLFVKLFNLSISNLPKLYEHVKYF